VERLLRGADAARADYIIHTEDATPSSAPTSDSQAQASFRNPGEVDLTYRLPCISIIINNYNYGRFLPDAITSAMRQTYPTKEIIVVDDGSSDNSQEIIASYGAQIVSILKRNGGQASALNAGFAQARGEIVLFLDADDMLLPGSLERLAHAFHREPHLAKVHFRMAVVGADGRATRDTKPPAHIRMLDGDLRRHYLTFPDDVWRLPTSGNAFPAWVLKRISPIPERVYRLNADTYLTHLAPLFGPVRFLNDVGAAYRVHGTNNYEDNTATLNLARVRCDVELARATHAALRHAAHALGLRIPEEGRRFILSTSFMINRLISYKLEPGAHAIKGDTLARLVTLGIRAAWRRFDIAPPMKALYILWFIAMAVAPARQARTLAEYMLFPSRRTRLNRLLFLWQRSNSRAHPRQTLYSVVERPDQRAMVAVPHLEMPVTTLSHDTGPDFSPLLASAGGDTSSDAL
jgi:glycosyltransferase involved in cell wall biosynthesis